MPLDNQLGLDGSGTVSALGLRWAALRGMLASALMEADEQQGLRAELVREMDAIERDLAGLAARSGLEVAAKIDIIQAALRQAGTEGALPDLLESIKADVRTLLPISRPRPERSSAHIVRSPNWAVEANSASSAPPAQATDEGSEPHE